MFILLTLILFSPNIIRALSFSSCDGVAHLEDQNYVFNSPDYPNSLPNETFTCTLKIEHTNTKNINYEGNCQNGTNNDQNGGSNNDTNVGEIGEICQVRLDFLDFDMQPPVLGNCHFDKMWTTANGKYPILCGRNTGNHMYLDVSGQKHTDISFFIDHLQTPLYSCPDRFSIIEPSTKRILDYDKLWERQENRLTVNVQAEDQLEHVEFDTRRAWSIKVTQIPCGCSSSTIDRSEYVPKAPTGCLQFHEGISGDIKSFNYDSLCCYSHDYLCNVKQLHDCSMNAGYTGHLNNLDYSICVKQEYGFCGIEYGPVKDELGSFSMTNKTEFFIDEEIVAHTGASNGDDSCLTDYLVLPGGHCKDDDSHYSSDRFCGNQLGVQGISQSIVQYSPPFIVQVVTDRDELTGSVDYMNRGFHMKYQQIPCR